MTGQPTVTVDLRYGAMAGINVFARDLWRTMVRLAGAEGVNLLGLVEERSARWASNDRLSGPTRVVRARPFLPVEQLVLPREIKRAGALVHHSPHFNVPYLSRAPVVLTVHDLYSYHDPTTARSRTTAAYYRWMLPAAVRRADVVVAVAQVTADDLSDTFGVDPAKLRVITHGIDHDRWKPASTDQVAATRRRLGVAEPYLLYVGAAKRHKNLRTILAAQGPELPALVVVGCTREEVAAHADPSSWRGRVHFVGPIPNEDLAPVYSGAVATLLPSVYESVGLPVWESMACGAPVIASSGGGLPETVGGAGVLVDPLDVDGWAAAMTRVVADAAYRSELVAAGLRRVRDLTWDDAALQYLHLYRELGAYSPSP
jgi:glycosyltransferase involved in cell wall biosynthesis